MTDYLIVAEDLCKAGTLRLLCAYGTRSGVVRLDAGRGALPRDRRRTSAHHEHGHLPENTPSPHRPRMTFLYKYHAG